MLDLYLCFADHAEAVSVLQDAGIGDGQGDLPVDGMAGGDAFALDLLFGTGVLLEFDGGSVVELPGCHVNLRWRTEGAPQALLAFLVAPATPAVRWA